MNKKKLEPKNVANIFRFVDENYMLSIEDFKHGNIHNENNIFDTYCDLGRNIVYTAASKNFIETSTNTKDYDITVNFTFNNNLYEYFTKISDEEVEYDVIRTIDEAELINENKILNLFEAL